MGDGGVERRLRHPDDRGTHARPEEVEGPHRELEAAVDLAQELLFRHENAIQLQPPDGVRREEVQRGSFQPFRIAIHDEGSDPLRSRPGGGPGKDRVDVRIRSIRDEDLGAGQAVALAVAFRTQGEGAGIRPGIRLGQGERRDGLTARDGSGVSASLLVGTGQDDRIRAEHLDGYRVLGQGRFPSQGFTNGAKIDRRDVALARPTGARGEQARQQSLLGQRTDQAPIDPSLLSRGGHRREFAGDGGRLAGEPARVRHAWRAPPSMTIPWPVIPRALSEQR